MRRALALALALIAASVPASANDSTAALTTGGLVLQRNDDIVMRSEDLFLSRKEVVVNYRFFNRSARDQTVTVAFPMPAITWQESVNIAIPDPESDNILKFRTRVNGKEVAAQVEQKAVFKGKDITARLKALNVPLLPSAKATGLALDALPEATQQALLKDEIVRPDDFDAGKGMEHHIAPEWTLNTTYYWQQTFPAGQETLIEHRYEPSVGSSVQTLIGSSYATPADLKKLNARYCTDASFVNAIKAMAKRNGGNPPSEQNIAYVLITGANWAGPIERFHLTVDKGDPRALVSFCETGVIKTGPTRFEVNKTGFTPTRDLAILFIDPLP